MIRYANDELKSGIVNMWKTCFGDPDVFMDMYFRNKYRHENTLVKVVNGKLVSSLQMLPYQLTFAENILPVAYISGAATFPEERKKGYMEELLVASFREMKQRNIPVSVLIPQEKWLFGFYEKFGYATVFDTGKTRVSLPTQTVENINVKKASLQDVPLIAGFCNAILTQRQLTIQKNEQDWYAVFEDYFLVNGKIQYALEDNQVRGVCFSFEDEAGNVIIKGLIAQENKIEKALLAEIGNMYGKKTAMLVDPEKGAGGKSVPFGMARIIDAGRMLSLFAMQYPELHFTIRISDEQLEWNNACYEIKSGKCFPVERNPDQTDFNIPIYFFTRLMFGYRIYDLPLVYHIFPEHIPYMMLMME
ncbi:MAG: GNAT family N-acetyltransferase [Candidatus Azobacteroides sp.]|nr:GNAT family N-acetyltransferase [Candidatus Azobacteroides sp.]